MNQTTYFSDLSIFSEKEQDLANKNTPIQSRNKTIVILGLTNCSGTFLPNPTWKILFVGSFSVAQESFLPSIKECFDSGVYYGAIANSGHDFEQCFYTELEKARKLTVRELLMRGVIGYKLEKTAYNALAKKPSLTAFHYLNRPFYGDLFEGDNSIKQFFSLCKELRDIGHYKLWHEAPKKSIITSKHF